MRCGNLDVQGETPISNDAGTLCLDDKPKEAAQREQYRRLSNVVFGWDPDSFTVVYPVEGPAPYIPLELVIKAIIAEMMKAPGDEGAQQIHDLIEYIIHCRKIPTGWEGSIIVSLYKDNGVSLEQGNHRSLIILVQAMTISREDGRELPKETSVHW